MPMIAITIINSMRVKPFWIFFNMCAPELEIRLKQRREPVSDIEQGPCQMSPCRHNPLSLITIYRGGAQDLT
jgi:hypothetical protein